MHVVGQNDFADFTQRRAHCSHLEQNVDAVAIFRDHALKPGYLPGNSLQSCLGVAAGSFIHVARQLHPACRCDPGGHKPFRHLSPGVCAAADLSFARSSRSRATRRMCTTPIDDAQALRRQGRHTLREYPCPVGVGIAGCRAQKAEQP